MGKCFSTEDITDAGRGLNMMINNDIQHDRMRMTKVKQILFLGSECSDTLKFFKQLQYSHGIFDDYHKEQFIKHIHTQVIEQMKSILQIYMEHQQEFETTDYKNQSLNENSYYEHKYDFELQSHDLQNVEAASLVLNYTYNKYKHELDSDVCAAIKTLWINEPVIKEIYKLRNMSKINKESSAYFWDKLEQIQDSNYLPTNEDIMLCQYKTTRVYEQTFEIKGDIMNIIDVSGQQSQMRKWIECFEYAVAVLFIANLSCYDEILNEDLMTNAMSEQIELFDSVVNDASLCNVAMILCFTETDLFKDKYCNNKIPLSKCDKFEEYRENDEWDYKRATEYIMNEFERLDRSGNKTIFTHLTSTYNIDKIFGDIREIIIANALEEGGYRDSIDD